MRRAGAEPGTGGEDGEVGSVRRGGAFAGDSVDEDDLADRIRRLEVKARRLLDSRALGAYDSIFRGHGVEFAEVREYQAGDPFQAIDWKVTARMGSPFVKRFVEERELSVLLAIDLSASGVFGTRRRLKRDLALEVAAVLATAAARAGDRVGLLLFSDRVERFLAPRRGRHRVRRLLHEAIAYRPEGRGTDIAAALEAAARALRVRSLILLLSDMQGAPFGRALAGTAQRHDVVGVELRDPAEEALPEAGLIAVRDPESGTERVLDLADPAVRSTIRTLAEDEERRTAELFRRAGCDRIVLRTDGPWSAELAAFFAARARTGRR